MDFINLLIQIRNATFLVYTFVQINVVRCKIKNKSAQINLLVLIATRFGAALSIKSK